MVFSHTSAQAEGKGEPRAEWFTAAQGAKFGRAHRTPNCSQPAARPRRPAPLHVAAVARSPTLANVLFFSAGTLGSTISIYMPSPPVIDEPIVETIDLGLP